jgi:hypothetical protein
MYDEDKLLYYFTRKSETLLREPSSASFNPTENPDVKNVNDNCIG